VNAVPSEKLIVKVPSPFSITSTIPIPSTPSIPSIPLAPLGPVRLGVVKLSPSEYSNVTEPLSL